jgi:hypothetical protein
MRRTWQIINCTPSWPGLSRPSTSYFLKAKEVVDARHKAGHDVEGAESHFHHSSITAPRISSSAMKNIST